jgi:hypothetical protein
MKLTRKLLGMVLLALAVSVIPAKADGIINFDLNGQGVDLKFSLPQTFIPDANVLGTFFVSNVQGTVNGQATVFDLDMGGIFLILPNFWGDDAQFTLFTPGLFSWNGNTVSLSTGTIVISNRPQITLTAVAAPEPSSLILLGMGGLSLLGLKLRRKTA